MLEKTCILGLVGGGNDPLCESKQVIIYDDREGKKIADLKFKSNVLNIKLKKDKILVVCENSIYIIMFADFKLIDTIDFGEEKYGRVKVLSEFGGYSLVEEGHCGSDHHFGYFYYNSREELNNAFKKLIIDDIIPVIPKGLSATVYTQVSDVEDEVNGLMTYDRKIIKVNEKMVKELNSFLQFLD